MATLAEMQTTLAELKTVRYSGVRRVSYEGKSTEYAPGAELERAIAQLEAEIAAAQGTPRPVARFARFGRAR